MRYIPIPSKQYDAVRDHLESPKIFAAEYIQKGVRKSLARALGNLESKMDMRSRIAPWNCEFLDIPPIREFNRQIDEYYAKKKSDEQMERQKLADCFAALFKYFSE
ncbi:MAG: hypothetical protein IJ575_09920 [Selenomonadaceae bacterium]|nr:hypothetical protein [Selenomonadaceae bacterium]